MTDAAQAERPSDEVPLDYDLDAEQGLLGFLLMKPAALTEVVEIVRARDFFDPVHRRIYECIDAAYARGDEFSVQQVMGSADALLTGGVTIGHYIGQLMSAASPSIDPAELADHIQQLGERRETVAADYAQRAAFQSAFGGQHWDEIGDETTKQGVYDWLVEDIIPLGEISLIFGDSGSGKSFSTFDILVKVARGQKFADKNVTQGLVIYVAAEAGKGFSKRKKAYTDFHKIQPDSPVPFYLCTKRPDFFSSDEDCDRLIREIEFVKRQYKLDVVAIGLDTLSALAPGMNENASQDVSMVRKRLVRLQKAFEDAAVILVHHKPKNGTTPRGHGSLTADFETTIEFEKTTDKDANRRVIYKGTVRKQREGKSGIAWSFTLPWFEVGRNKWGNVETSCVAVPYLHPTISSTGYKPNARETVFLKALHEALAEDPAAPPPELGLPKSINAVVEQFLLRAKVAAMSIQGDDDDEKHKNRLKQLIHAAGKSLRAAGVIGTHDKPSSIVWLTGKPIQGFTQRIAEEGPTNGA